MQAAPVSIFLFGPSSHLGVRCLHGAWSILGQNAHYGTPVNPANPARMPGGSSSGSGVVVAANLVDFSLGENLGHPPLCFYLSWTWLYTCQCREHTIYVRRRFGFCSVKNQDFKLSPHFPCCGTLFWIVALQQGPTLVEVSGYRPPIVASWGSALLMEVSQQLVWLQWRRAWILLVCISLSYNDLSPSEKALHFLFVW